MKNNSNKKIPWDIIIVIIILLILFVLDKFIHWAHFIIAWVEQSNRIERFGGICVILLVIIISSFVCIRQYENKCGGRHETVRVISKILVLTMLGNFCMNILGGMATNELYELIGSNESESEGKNDGSVEEYVSENNNTELPDFSESEYPSVDKLVVGWSDNSGLKEGRLFYTKDEINNGAIGNQIVFNSISDSVIGHEANFVGARENTGPATKETLWNANSIEVEEGKNYLVRLYAHNNSMNGLESVALDTRVRFAILDTVVVTKTENGEGNYQAAIYGYITSSNAVPSQYMDGVKFVSNRPFHLVYIRGTALFENNAIGLGGRHLSDDVITKGVLIGYDEFNGEIPGCYQFDSFTTIKIMPIFDD